MKPKHVNGDQYRRDINSARLAASQTGRSILQELAVLWQCSVRLALERIAANFHYGFFDALMLSSAEADFSRISLAKAVQRRCFAFTLQRQRWIVLCNPFDVELLNWIDAMVQTETQAEIQTETQSQTQIALIEDAELHALLSKAEAQVNAVDQREQDRAMSEGETRGEELSLIGIAQDSSAVVRLVNSTIYDALKAGASDLHFETSSSGVEVKYRIDGVLDMVTSVAGAAFASQTISRIKVLAELDIAERRIPQDGRFRVTVGGRTTDLRVSIMPSIHGEDAVLRILDKRQLLPAGGKLSLDLLGFDTESLQRIRRLTAQPYGMLLVTGPTGSGKTTTLYSAISETWTGRDKIITIEDPVEYELPGVLQIPVNEKKGLSFARGLRSILRHDPDRIMVGEIRDGETAEIAVQSALTGHLVLSTVHANSVFDVFSRFAHMGVDAHALVAALNGVLAQRLLRSVCRHCACEDKLDATSRLALGLGKDTLQGQFLQGRGCGECRGTGYQGRIAIAEILTMNDQLRQAIIEKAPIATMKAMAKANGTHSLREAALALAQAGKTSLAEVVRVTMQELV